MNSLHHPSPLLSHFILVHPKTRCTSTQKYTLSFRATTHTLLCPSHTHRSSLPGSLQEYTQEYLHSSGYHQFLPSTAASWATADCMWGLVCAKWHCLTFISYSHLVRKKTIKHVQCWKRNCLMLFYITLSKTSCCLAKTCMAYKSSKSQQGPLCLGCMLP